MANIGRPKLVHDHSREDHLALCGAADRLPRKGEGKGMVLLTFAKKPEDTTCPRCISRRRKKARSN